MNLVGHSSHTISLIVTFLFIREACESLLVRVRVNKFECCVFKVCVCCTYLKRVVDIHDAFKHCELRHTGMHKLTTRSSDIESENV